MRKHPAPVFAPAYYTASVTVRANPDGTLTAAAVLTKTGSDYKPDACAFTRAEAPTDTPTQPVPTTQAPIEPPGSRPQTGDDSRLEIYLLICITASAGLFLLSVAYYKSTCHPKDK